MAGALLKVGMRRDTDEGDRELAASQRVGEAPELPGNI
jgi:hypothetical protein